jgi:hypothetical protein
MRQKKNKGIRDMRKDLTIQGAGDWMFPVNILGDSGGKFGYRDVLILSFGS